MKNTKISTAFEISLTPNLESYTRACTPDTGTASLTDSYGLMCPARQRSESVVHDLLSNGSAIILAPLNAALATLKTTDFGGSDCIDVGAVTQTRGLESTVETDGPFIQSCRHDLLPDEEETSIVRKCCPLDQMVDLDRVKCVPATHRWERSLGCTFRYSLCSVWLHVCTEKPARYFQQIAHSTGSGLEQCGIHSLWLLFPSTTSPSTNRIPPARARTRRARWW